MTAAAGPYDERFFSELADAWQSAERVLPLVVELISPATAVDVGCGTGGWLRVLARAHGCEILGVDGDYVPPDALEIDRDHFVPRDLGQTLDLDRRFDLALSLEVAEHLPADRAAGFVRDLTELAPAVLFSAAVPGQGGVEHVHERWQSYWIDHFHAVGFQVWDVIRPAIWHDDQVAYCYRQNTFLFVDPDVHGDRPELAPTIADVVHPELLRLALEASASTSLGSLLRTLPPAIGRSLRHRAGAVEARFRR